MLPNSVFVLSELRVLSRITAALLTLSLPITACEHSGDVSEAKIVGGTIPDNWHWTVDATVAITNDHFYPNRISYCSGTVIAPNAVLTAGHCMEPEYESTSHWIIWGKSLDPSEPRRKVVRRIRHPDYREPSTLLSGPFNDLAIFIFDGSIPTFYRQSPMVSADVTYIDDEPFVVAGYGITREGAPNSDTGVMRWTEVRFDRVLDTNKELYLVGDQGQNTCKGDSGGPAYNQITYPDGVKSIELAGVTSWGVGCSDGTGHYVDLRKYRAWIDSMLSDH